MQKFQWLLNPRQVFDLTDGGPGPAIEMFRHVPNIKLLACGGDGTVGWLLSVLDKVTIDPPPAVGVLPLGTGNDLSRYASLWIYNYSYQNKKKKNHKLLTHSKNFAISFLLSEKKIKWLFLKLSVPIQKKNEPENLVV